MNKRISAYDSFTAEISESISLHLMLKHCFAWLQCFTLVTLFFVLCISDSFSCLQMVSDSVPFPPAIRSSRGAYSLS